MAKVRVHIIGNAFGLFGVLMWKGQKAWIDEKQAELMEAAGVAEIIEKTEPITKKYTGKR